MESGQSGRAFQGIRWLSAAHGKVIDIIIVTHNNYVKRPATRIPAVDYLRAGRPGGGGQKLWTSLPKKK
jgi:hypothetical protein